MNALSFNYILFFIEHLFADTRVGEKFSYMDGDKSPRVFPQTPPDDIFISPG